jgi:hypothetical protein
MTEPGSTVFQPLPKGWTAFVYSELPLSIHQDSADDSHRRTPTNWGRRYKSREIPYSRPDFKDGEDGVQLTKPENTTGETRFVLIAGEPLDQPVVQVCSTLLV